MNHKIFISVIVFLIPAVSMFAGNQLVIAEKAEPQYNIIVPVKPSIQETNAAKDLKHYLDLITGGNFSLVKENDLKSKDHGIYIGKTAAFIHKYAKIDLKKLGNDGIALKTDPSENIYLNGGVPRGVFYAVATFLEDYCGVRWWTRSAETVPSRPNLTVSVPDRIYIPQIKYRETWYKGVNSREGSVKDKAKFCIHTKNNGHFCHLSEEWGGSHTLLGWCHTFFQLIPPKKYFKDHPEWFSEVNGKRIKNGQLCLCNEAMRKELVKNAMKWLEKNPNADMISIAQNDSAGECECPVCKALKEKEGASSGPIINFVNKVAADINAKYPNVKVITLAYLYSLKPPKTLRSGKNVIVQLCSYGGDWARPFDSPNNKEFYDALTQWSRKADTLAAWIYLTDFTNILNPIPNYFSFGRNIRILSKNHVKMVFAQGNSFAPLGDFDKMKTWVIAKLLWDPSLDNRTLVKEFMDGYYGSAGKYLYQCLWTGVDDLHNRPGRFYASGNPWLSLNGINKETELFQKAEKAVVNNATLLERIRQARLSLDFQWILGWKAYKSLAIKQHKTFNGPSDLNEAYRQFKENCKRWNVKNLSEGKLTFSLLDSFFAQKGQIKLPAPYDKMLQSRIAVAPAKTFTRYGTPLVKDAEAANGLAAAMTANHKDWGIQFCYPGLCGVTAGKWRCLASVRVDAKANKGNAVELGVYDSSGKNVPVVPIQPIKKFKDGKYHLVDMGVFDFTGNTKMLYAAPLKNPDKVNKIYVDRFIFIAEQ